MRILNHFCIRLQNHVCLGNEFFNRIDPVRSFMNGCFQAGRGSFGRASLRLARQLIEARGGASARRLRVPNHELSRDRGGGGRAPVTGRFVGKRFHGAIQWPLCEDGAATVSRRMKLVLPDRLLAVIA